MKGMDLLQCKSDFSTLFNRTESLITAESITSERIDILKAVNIERLLTLDKND